MKLPPHLQSTLDRISAAQLTDRAAALTYYGFLSLFPALIIGVALLGILGTYPDTYQEIIRTLRDAAPGPVVDVIDQALQDAVDSRGGASGLLGVGLVVTLYSASGATGAALRGVETVYSIGRDGAWWHGYVARFAMTLTLGLLFLVAFAAILLAGPLFNWVSDLAGISESVNTFVAIVRWPIGLSALILAATLLYWVGSGRRRPLLRLLPGAICATAITLVASLGFHFYVANFDSYGATYGSLGAVIVLLIWMWLSSLALLFGAVINIELEQRASAAGGS